MRVAVFSTKSYDREFLGVANAHHNHELMFYEARLTPETTPLAAGFPAICAFVNDLLSADVVHTLADGGTRLIALRSAGFNNVDLVAASERGLSVVRVPAYSPHAVAEHTVALMLALNRKITRASSRVREGNFSLEGLLGFDMYSRTVGVIGTGTIGSIVAGIMLGFGCQVVAYDKYPSDACRELGVRYVELPELFATSDIITLHCPLLPETYHIIDADALRVMKHGVMLINTGRGALLDTRAVIDALKSDTIGYLGLDVYEEEEDLFFRDLSNTVIRDDVFARLLIFPNVLITGHQAFFTREALETIAETTLENISRFEQGRSLPNQITAQQVVQ